jgi:hypothetical protein
MRERRIDGVIIEEEDCLDPSEWTPARGVVRGAVGVLLSAAVLGTAWCVLAWNRPDLAVGYKHEEPSVMFATGFLTAIIAFAICWALFAVMHRRAQMCGGLCPVIVAAAMLLIIIAKQITVASSSPVDTIEGQLVSGVEWLAPARFFTSNIGAWIGTIAGVYAFREGNSILEYLTRS